MVAINYSSLLFSLSRLTITEFVVSYYYSVRALFVASHGSAQSAIANWFTASKMAAAREEHWRAERVEAIAPIEPGLIEAELVY